MRAGRDKETRTRPPLDRTAGRAAPRSRPPGRNCRTAPLASHTCSNPPHPAPSRPARPGPAPARRRPSDGFRHVAGGWPDILRKSVRSAVVDVLDTYSGHTGPRWRRRPPRPRRPDHHQGLGRPDGQQRLPPGVHRDRRGVADRRGERAGPAGGGRRLGGRRSSCAPRSPRTATTTTGRPSVRWPTSSAPGRSRTPSTPPSCRCPSTTRSSTAARSRWAGCRWR